MKSFGKILIAATIAVLLIGSAATSAQAGDHRTFGMGFVLGEPTGLSAKLFIRESHALDFDLGLFFLNGNGAILIADYLYHFKDVLPGESIVLMRPYIGGGVPLSYHQYKDKDDKNHSAIGIGARFTAGLSFLFTTVPLETFIDLSPTVGLVPGVGFDLDGVIGLRYFF